MLTRTVRGLVVSPWFAAGAGFVIAATVIVFTPHAQLNSAINVTHCKVAGCRPAQSQGVDPLVPAGVGGGKIAGGSSAAIAGLTFSYGQQWEYEHRFGIVITIRADHALGSWHLKLSIPGATHLTVSGAQWKPSGRNSGTASGSGGGSNGQADAASAAPILNPNVLDSAELVRGQYLVQFYIGGTGTARPPNCIAYNRSPCHFVAISPAR